MGCGERPCGGDDEADGYCSCGHADGAGPQGHPEGDYPDFCYSWGVAATSRRPPWSGPAWTQTKNSSADARKFTQIGLRAFGASAPMTSYMAVGTGDGAAHHSSACIRVHLLIFALKFFASRRAGGGCRHSRRCRGPSGVRTAGMLAGETGEQLLVQVREEGGEAAALHNDVAGDIGPEMPV